MEIKTRRYKPDQKVQILRGKNKGRRATVAYETTPHHLSRERRFYLHLDSWQTFWSNRYVLMNESGFKVIEDKA